MFEDRTPEAIKEEIKNRLSGEWDTREGSFADDMAGPLALELSRFYSSFGAIKPMVWVDETSGPFLDEAARDLGLVPRKEAQKARAVLRIAGEAGYAVPRGAVFLTADGMKFAALDAARLSLAEEADEDEGEAEGEGIALVGVQALEAGAAHNVAADAITMQFSNAAQIRSVTNPEPADGGTDEESDRALFTRIDQARKRPRTSGNIHDYEAWAKEVPGVETVRVFPVAYGRGTVMVLIGDDSRKPVTPAIVENCRAHIESVMPIGGIDLFVRTPEEVKVNVDATVVLDGSVALDAVREGFVKALEVYFSDVSLAEFQARRNMVGALLIKLPGVVDFDMDSLLLNGLADNVSLSREQSPVVGEVVLSQAQL